MNISDCCDKSSLTVKEGHMFQQLVQVTHSIWLYLLLKRAHSVQNENREHACCVLGAKVLLCVCGLKKKSHSDAGAEGWVNMSYLDHTHAHTKIITVRKHRYTLSTKNTHICTHEMTVKTHKIKLLPYPLPVTGRANEPRHFPRLGARGKRSQK